MTRLLVSMLLLGSAACAQPAFEAATVRSASSDSGGGRASTSGDRVTLNRTTLMNALARAFRLASRDQVVGPDWIFTERYDIAAKAPGNTPPEELPRMLQTLLIERFQLKLHHETRDLPGYVLALGKGRLKLEEVKNPTVQNDFSIAGGHRAARAMSMAALSTSLTSMLQAPVTDHTGLGGYYNFPLDPTKEETRAETAPSVFDLLDELGLKLEPRKLPLDVIVIESGSKVPIDN